VCPAIGGAGELPACTAADRVAAGVRWSLVIAGCYVLTTAAVLLSRQRSRVLVPVAVVAFAVLCALSLQVRGDPTEVERPTGAEDHAQVDVLLLGHHAL